MAVGVGGRIVGIAWATSALVLLGCAAHDSGGSPPPTAAQSDPGDPPLAEGWVYMEPPGAGFGALFPARSGVVTPLEERVGARPARVWRGARSGVTYEIAIVADDPAVDLDAEATALLQRCGGRAGERARVGWAKHEALVVSGTCAGGAEARGEVHRRDGKTLLVRVVRTSTDAESANDVERFFGDFCLTPCLPRP